MKSLKSLALGAVVALSLGAASSASAAVPWDPQNTNVTGTSSNSVLTDSNGNTVTCTSASTTLRAVGDLATAQGAHNPVAYSNCSNSLIPGATSVTTFGTWTFTATSTTSVDARAVRDPSGAVAVISLPLGCTITVDGPVSIPNNGWNNATHQLEINSSVSFPVTQSATCFGIVGATARLSGTFTLPSSVIIT
ncbi:MAG: hypothetical protein ABW167_10945 [Baekduia sp.]